MIADESVAEFISFTGAGPDEARYYLEMAGGELQQAVNLFLEMGPAAGAMGSPAMQPAPPPAQAAPMPGGVVDAAVAAEVAAAAAAAGIETEPAQLPDVHMADADEVRAPMPAFQDQIINPDMERRRMQEAIAADTASMSRRMAFDRPVDAAGAGSGDDAAPPHNAGSDAQGGGPGGDPSAINQLFAPPAYNENNPWFQVLQKAKEEGKWILVNIQQAEVFASHTLNRDVWSDDTIKDILQGSFLFWQRDDKSTEGNQFCEYYQCGHQLPHICIVDPRTGRRVRSWDGRKWVESHAAAEYLFGFLDDFSMSKSPPSMSPSASPKFVPQEPSTNPGGDVQFSIDGLSDHATGGQASEAPGPPAASEAVEEPPKEPVCALPEEPAEGVEHLKVSFRMPSGQRVTRRFVPTDTVEQMFVVASALSEMPPTAVDLSTQFPKRSLRDIDGGLQALLKDAQVAGCMVVVAQRRSSTV
mmetsp:Transcript_20707/g.58072  ORF Transcript_20707/g.58072 Transcript_20707/m.58072 type:complete len:471 (-) Transcript_20707:32-1444(-)